MFTDLRLQTCKGLWLVVAISGAACGSASTTSDANASAAGTGAPKATAPTQAASGGMAAAPIPSAAAGHATPASGAAGSTRGATMSSAGSGGAAGSAGKAAAAGGGTAGAGGSAGAGAGGMQQAGAGGVAGSAAATSGTPLVSLMYPTTQEKVSDAPVFHITRPMDLALPGGPRPVIAWANGGCFRSDSTWQPLFDRWAGAGFVVLSLTGSGADDDIASMLDSSTDTDHAALIDWAVKANESGPYAGKLDLSRIVLSGNSCGGVTALEVASKEKRVAAVFVLSGSSALGSVDTQIMQAISIPVGYVTGSPSEDVAAPNAADDYAALKDGIPAMLVQRTSGDHVTVSTDEKVLPEDAEIALNWLDLALYGTKQARDTLSSPNVCEHCTPGNWKFMGKNLDKLVK